MIKNIPRELEILPPTIWFWETRHCATNRNCEEDKGLGGSWLNAGNQIPTCTRYPVPWGMKFCSTSPNTGRFSWAERDVFDDALVLLLPIFIRGISCCFVPFLDHKKRSHKQHCHIWKEIAFGIHVKFPWVYSMNFLFDIRFLPWQTRYQALWTGKSTSREVKSEADKGRTCGKFRGLQKTIWQIVGSPLAPLNLVRFLLSFTKKTPKNQPSEDVSLIKNGDFPLQNLSLQGDKPLVHKKTEQFCLKPLVECWRRSKVRKYLVAELKKPGPHPSRFDKKLM